MEGTPSIEGSDGELHDEIIASQNARARIWNWKLILISVLAAAGLGISVGASPNTGTPLVLCCIPVVCAYADLLCNHLSVRNHLIGAWRRTRHRSVEFKEYERFAQSLKDKGVWRLEWWAVYSSSIAANVGLVLVGAGKGGGDLHAAGQVLLFRSSPAFGAVAVSGLLGILATALVWRAARSRHQCIERTALQITKAAVPSTALTATPPNPMGAGAPAG
jgi:hypothetical protein